MFKRYSPLAILVVILIAVFIAISIKNASQGNFSPVEKGLLAQTPTDIPAQEGETTDQCALAAAGMASWPPNCPCELVRRQAEILKERADKACKSKQWYCGLHDLCQDNIKSCYLLARVWPQNEKDCERLNECKMKVYPGGQSTCRYIWDTTLVPPRCVLWSYVTYGCPVDQIGGSLCFGLQADYCYAKRECKNAADAYNAFVANHLYCFDQMPSLYTVPECNNEPELCKGK